MSVRDSKLIKTIVNELMSQSNLARIRNLFTSGQNGYNVPKIRLNRNINKRRSAVLVPICKVDGQLAILFTIRTNKVSTHKGQVSFPGGSEDDDDDFPIVTAIRETREEINLNVNRNNIIGVFGAIPSLRNGDLVTAVIANLTEINIDKLEYNTDEVQSVFTLPFTTLLDRSYQRYTIYSSISYYPIPVFTGAPKRIWGLTALILDMLIDMIVDTSKYDYKSIRKQQYDAICNQ